jgi:radical S-adenosyl methionine domain-containing protein 2
VTNGANLLKVLDEAPGAVHWVGLSVDSGVEAVQAELGRGAGDHNQRSIELADEVRARGIRLKLNTVVTSANWLEDMSDLVRRIRPERWKAFQVLRVEGENDRTVGPLLITPEQYGAFVARHDHLAAEGLGLIPEDNDAMRGSYVMIDPQGRFFSNETRGYTISEPILSVGVQAALAQVGWRSDKFEARGGRYEWGARTPARGPVIAIEGLDGSGKTTSVNLLAERLGARVMRNPPQELAGERAAADLLEPSARRAWYQNANRVAMDLARAHEGPAVLDRSIASTLVFGAAERGTVATVADIPGGFPWPDVVVFLAIPEEKRARRIAGRAGSRTAEEERLADDDLFRARVLQGYANLCSVVVDANGSPEQVVERVLAMLKTPPGAVHARRRLLKP